MAMTYQNFASLGVNLNRQKYGPLDISNVFTSAADLKYYLTKGAFTEGVSEYWYKNASEKVVPYPYEGQVLATVIDGVVEVFVLALDTKGNFETREIGAKVEADGKTIKVNAEGKLELVGLPADIAGKTLVPSLINGELSWAEPDTSTAEGQAQEIDGLKARATALESAVGNADDGLVKDVADNKSAIEAEVDRATKAEEALSDRIDAIDFIDSNELTEAIKDFATKTYVNDEIDKIEAAIAGLNHFKTEIVANIDDVKETGVLYLIKDESVTGVDKYNEYIVVDDVATLIGDTTTDLSNYYNKTEIDNKVTTLEGSITDEVEARESLAERVSDLEAIDNTTQQELDAYKAEVAAALAKKIETGSIAHAVVAVEADPEKGIEAVEGIPEGVTVEGTKLKIVVDAPTRAETIKLIADKVADVTGGESAADVKLNLESEVARSTAADSAHDAALAVLQGNASTAGSVAEAKALAQKGVDDAANVAADLVTANATIADNTREIGVAKSSIQTVNETLTGRITVLENKDATIESNIAAIQTTVSGTDGHASRITTVEGDITALKAKDTEFAGKIDTKANAADVYTKGEVDVKVSEAIGTINLDPYAKTADVDKAVETINASITAKANAEEVYTKEAADGKFQTEAQVDARINALIVAADPEGGKTIENIQNLVKYVDDNAGDIAELISTVDDHTQMLSEIDATIVALVQPKASAEISVANDGTLGIIGMSTDKLVQGSMVLVLNGGDAGTAAVEV